MVRSATYRTSKYDAKMVGDVIKNRIDAQKDSMVAQVTTQFGLLEALETAVKSVLITGGATTITMPYYLAYARQCWKLIKNHGVNAISEAEAKAFANCWEDRGLTSALLILVAAEAGLTITAPF